MELNHNDCVFSPQAHFICMRPPLVAKRPLQRMGIRHQDAPALRASGDNARAASRTECLFFHMFPGHCKVVAMQPVSRYGCFMISPPPTRSRNPLFRKAWIASPIHENHMKRRSPLIRDRITETLLICKGWGRGTGGSGGGRMIIWTPYLSCSKQGS